MQTVELSKAECQIARYIGKRRNRMSQDTKTNQRRDPNQGDEEMNIEAAGAELSVAKALNVYPDLTPTTGLLPGWDLNYNGSRVEVKRNHLRSGDLLVPKLDRSLIYILVCGQLPHYVIMGYIEGNDVPLRGEWVDLTYGPCWRVQPGQLHPIEIITLNKSRVASNAD